jgi:GTP pyrophosphokinase
VHSLWPHQPEHFADHISNPKANGYRSIHTKVIVPGHGPMEVQIRTAEMHREAEYGVAAHWRYKEDGAIDEPFAQRMTVMRRLFEMARSGEPEESGEDGGESTAQDQGDFLREIEASLWGEEIFVYTPKGEVIDLPEGATVVDFAYRIHTMVGHTCIGAKVNRRIVPLDHALRSGDQVEILRQRNTGPSRDWLKFVRTSTARTRIRAYLRRKDRDTLVERGQQLLEAEAQRQKIDYKDLFRRDRLLDPVHRRRAPDQPAEDLLTRVARRRSFNSDEDLLTAVGDRIVSAEGVIHTLVSELEDCERAAGLAAPESETLVTRAPSDQSDAGAVSVRGAGNLMYRRSKCCLPIPGDAIVGYITRGTGIAIHREDCPNLRHLREREPDRVVNIEWSEAQHAIYDVPLEIRANDRMGLLKDLAGLVSELGVNITGANTVSAPLRSAGDHTATMHLRLEFVNRAQLDELIRRLPALGVVKVTIRGQVFHDTEKGGRLVRREPGTPSPAGRLRRPVGKRRGGPS